MATLQRPFDRGTQRGRDLIIALGREIRLARRAAGLSLAAVGRAAGMSASEVSRIERARVPNVSVIDLARLASVVGLDLTARLFPGGDPLRDRGHARLLDRLRTCLDPALRWRTEVPLPRAGDIRAWDATITHPGRAWTCGVEAETRPADGQALSRRLALKRRDGGTDHVILLLPDTRHARAFRAQYSELLAGDFPVSGPDALARLAVGQDPGGNAVIVR